MLELDPTITTGGVSTVGDVGGREAALRSGAVPSPSAKTTKQSAIDKLINYLTFQGPVSLALDFNLLEGTLAAAAAVAAAAAAGIRTWAASAGGASAAGGEGAEAAEGIRRFLISTG